MFHHMTVIGCGMMGGSLALAMRHAGLVQHITGYGLDSTSLQWAQTNRVIDYIASSSAQAVDQADLVVLAVPVAAMRDVMADIAAHIQPQAVITDVGSTKQNILADAQATLGGHLPQFVPAHPIAGKERAGVQQATADLYQGRQVILTPSTATSADALARITQMWMALGCAVQTMTAQAHDVAFAAVSHVPHLAAFALMHSILHQSDAQATLALGGAGFQDFTRIAAGDAAMWRDIFLCNRDEVLAQTRLLAHAMQRMSQLIEQGDGEALHALIAQASSARTAWRMTTHDDNARL